MLKIIYTNLPFFFSLSLLAIGASKSTSFSNFVRQLHFLVKFSFFGEILIVKQWLIGSEEGKIAYQSLQKVAKGGLEGGVVNLFIEATYKECAWRTFQPTSLMSLLGFSWVWPTLTVFFLILSSRTTGRCALTILDTTLP